MRRTWIIGAMFLFLIGVAFAYHRYTLSRFESAYHMYSSLAARHDEAATIPMLPENPLRRDLSTILADVLVGEVSAAERRARAEEGLALLVLAEGHIDAVGEVSEDVTKAIFALEHETSLAALGARTDERALIDQAHRRLSIIADIRGLSYRANHDMKTIFERIIADKGVLTKEHQASLDRQLPEIEVQFNRRTNLYAELERVGKEMRIVFTRIESTW